MAWKRIEEESLYDRIHALTGNYDQTAGGANGFIDEENKSGVFYRLMGNHTVFYSSKIDREFPGSHTQRICDILEIFDGLLSLSHAMDYLWTNVMGQSGFPETEDSFSE